MKDEPRHLDLFSGIGGFALAAAWAGFQTVGFSEIDQYASAVLKKHWPEVTNYGDIRNVPAVQCDLITGGFPCQPFSTAGHRKGKEDDRWLWPEMFRIIKESRPTWVLGENVAHFGKMALDDVLSDLEGAGYSCRTFDIPACAVQAAPHRRQRLWIVAHASGRRRNKWERCGEKGSLHKNQKRDPAPVYKDWKELQPVSWPIDPDNRWKTYISKCSGVVNGIPSRMDRIRALGNAIVPQVAYEIIRLMKSNQPGGGV